MIKYIYIYYYIAQFIPLFMNYLSRNELKCNSLLCLDEVISKGMNIDDKLLILKELNILNIIQSFDINNNDNEFYKCIGEFVSDLCNVLSDLIDEINGNMNNKTIINQYSLPILNFMNEFIKKTNSIETKKFIIEGLSISFFNIFLLIFSLIFISTIY